jgi:hypothetical protein
VPENMDGSPLGETLRAGAAPTRMRLEVGAAGRPAGSDGEGMTREEEAEVAESLRNLGYLE